MSPVVLDCPSGDCVMQSGTTYVLTGVASVAPDLTTTVAPTLDLTDLAGNTASPVLPLSVDVVTTAPAPLDVDTPGQLVYTRIPWGDGGGPPRFSVSGTTAVTGSILITNRRAPPWIELGRGPVVGGEAFDPIALAPTDWPVAYATQIDRAGNRAATVRIRDVRWVASLLGKRAESLVENPHRFFARPFFADLRTTSDDIELDDLAGIGSPDGFVAVTNHGGRWSKRMASGDDPIKRGAAGLTYDERRDRVVLFGGATTEPGCPGSPTYTCNDTREWDGERWTWVTGPAPSEPPFAYFGMAYDSWRGVSVMFAQTGFSQSVVHEWDGTSWRAIVPLDPEADGNPGPRRSPALTFDAVRGHVLLFGGEVDWGSRYGDTWAWNGVSWRLLDAGGNDRPAGRIEASMAFSETDGVALLFGGECDDFGACDGDPWAWNGTTWTPREPATGPVPAQRRSAAMVYDPYDDEFLLFGGMATATSDCDASGVAACNSLWRWADDQWSPVPVSGTWPSPRSHVAAAFAKRTRELLVFGGFGCVGSCEGLWAWSGTAWRAAAPRTLTATNTPLARNRHAAAYDPLTQRVLIHGGDAGEGALCGGADRYCKDTWSFDGQDWTPLASSAEPRVSHAMVGTPTGPILVGGITATGDPPIGSYLGDTLAWDGLAWTTLAAGGVSARIDHALAYHDLLGVPVLYGGYGSNCDGDGTNLCGRVWRLDASSWSEVAVNDDSGDGSPVPRDQHGMAFDVARGVLATYTFLYNPSVDRSQFERWELDADGDWHEGAITPDFGALTDSHPRLSYDPDRQRIIMFERGVKVWEWHENGLRRVDMASGAGGLPGINERVPPVVYYAGRHVIFGGQNPISATQAVDDTWLWDSGASTRPTHIAEIAYAASHAPSTSPLSLAIDFAPSQAQTPEGMATDLGGVFGPHPGTPSYGFSSDRSAAAAYRSNYSSFDVILQTIISLDAATTWEVALDDGTYDVTLVVGDAAVTSGASYAVEAEGLPIVSGAPTALPFSPFLPGTLRLAVQDGRLTLTSVGANDAPLAAIWIALAPETLTQLEVQWHAGGRGSNGSSEVPGAELYAWSAGRWLPLTATHQAAPEATAPLLFVSQDLALNERLLRSGAGALRFAATPRENAANATPAGQIATDSVEMRVDYRLP